MHGDLWAITFALCSGLCMALGAVVRQRVTANPDAAARSVLVTPSWWLGVGIALLGFVFQALALSAGPLLLVQPLLVTSLLFMLPLGLWVNGIHPPRAQWIWSLVLTTVVALLLVVGDPEPGTGHVSKRVWIAVIVMSAAATALFSLAARRFPGNVRAMILGGGSGALFGGAAVVTKQLTGHIHADGMAVIVRTWETPTLLATAVLAVVLQQMAYSAGELRASFPAALLAEQAAGVTLGILVLGESIAHGTGTRILLATLALIACAVAVRLGLSEQAGAPARTAPHATT